MFYQNADTRYVTPKVCISSFHRVPRYFTQMNSLGEVGLCNEKLYCNYLLHRLLSYSVK
jgi:hypothetical protein